MDFQFAPTSGTLGPQKGAPFPISPTYFKIEQREHIKPSSAQEAQSPIFIQDTQMDEPVVVLPSKFDSNKELVIGFATLSLLVFVMFMFGFFTYLGSQQYKKYLKNRDMSIVNDLDLEYGNYPMTEFNTAKEEKSLISPTKLGPIVEHESDDSTSNASSRVVAACVDFETDSHISSTEISVTEGIDNVEFASGTEGELGDQDESYKPLNPINTKEMVQEHMEEFIDHGRLSSKNIRSALSTLIDYAQIEPIDIIQEENGYYGLKEEKQEEAKPFVPTKSVNPVIVYRKSEIVSCEPQQLYTLIKYANDDELLVTDLVFPETPIMRNLGLLELEKEFNQMRFILGRNETNEALKHIELMRFVNSSLGMKKTINPRVFLYSYALLVDTILDKCLHTINVLSRFSQLAIVEVIVKYCLNCWSYDAKKFREIVSMFQEVHIVPYAPAKPKIFKTVAALFVAGYRPNLLEQVLVFFATPPTPCALSFTLDEILESTKFTQETKELMGFLKRQLEDEHKRCCAKPNDQKHIQFTSPHLFPKRECIAGFPNKHDVLNLQMLSSAKSWKTGTVNEERLPGSLCGSPNLKSFI